MFRVQRPCDDEIVIIVRSLQIRNAGGLIRKAVPDPWGPFTQIEMRLDKDGSSESRMAMATKISKSKDGKTIELENYGISPVALNNITLRK